MYGLRNDLENGLMNDSKIEAIRYVESLTKIFGDNTYLSGLFTPEFYDWFVSACDRGDTDIINALFESGCEIVRLRGMNDVFDESISILKESCERDKERLDVLEVITDSWTKRLEEVETSISVAVKSFDQLTVRDILSMVKEPSFLYNLSESNFTDEIARLYFLGRNPDARNISYHIFSWE